MTGSLFIQKASNRRIGIRLEALTCQEKKGGIITAKNSKKRCAQKGSVKSWAIDTTFFESVSAQFLYHSLYPPQGHYYDASDWCC